MRSAILGTVPTIAQCTTKGDQMLVTITIKVNYDEATNNKSSLLEELKDELTFSIEDGLLTPSGDEIVDSHSIEII